MLLGTENWLTLLRRMVEAHTETISNIIDYVDILSKWVDEVSAKVENIEPLRLAVKESRKQINESRENIKTLETEVTFLLDKQ